MGTVHCICPITGEQRDLAFEGFKVDRDTIEYRCPAAALTGSTARARRDVTKPVRSLPGANGRIVRIKVTEQDGRIFVPTPLVLPPPARLQQKSSDFYRSIGAAS